MPITLADLKKGRRTISVALPEGTVTMTYRSGEVTLASFEELATITRMVANWVESWDLMDGDEMYPISEESVARLPQSFVCAIWDAIGEDVRSRPTRKSGSMKSG